MTLIIKNDNKHTLYEIPKVMCNIIYNSQLNMLEVYTVFFIIRNHEKRRFQKKNTKKIHVIPVCLRNVVVTGSTGDMLTEFPNIGETQIPVRFSKTNILVENPV